MEAKGNVVSAVLLALNVATINNIAQLARKGTIYGAILVMMNVLLEPHLKIVQVIIYVQLVLQTVKNAVVLL